MKGAESSITKNEAIKTLNQPFSCPRKYIDVKISTFLGNDRKSYYGNNPPDSLNLIWKCFLGSGYSVVKPGDGERLFCGAGWTGQPLLIEEQNHLYIIIGAYDHNLKKIDAENGNIVWQYNFGDIIKGTGSIWVNEDASSPEDRYLILQGSRRGLNKSIFSQVTPSFRAISYLTGKEVWSLNIKKTDSYSRDVDGSALIIRDTVYIGLENGTFAVINPDPEKIKFLDSLNQPEIIQELKTYSNADIQSHGGNLVNESSPCLLNNHIYFSAGSGHVYGYDMKTRTIDWDLFLKADLNGSLVVTSDSCLLIPIEKQYIPGFGGVLKADPSKAPDECIQWFFPTGNNQYADWQGGVIGSPAINDSYTSGKNFLAAFIGIDGNLHVVDHKKTNNKIRNSGPLSDKEYYSPVEIFSFFSGPSISTPVFYNDMLIVAGYSGLYCFSYDKNNNFNLISSFKGVFESTPVAWNNRLYIASRDGYFYCFGDSSSFKPESLPANSDKTACNYFAFNSINSYSQKTQRKVSDVFTDQKLQNSVEDLSGYLKMIKDNREKTTAHIKSYIAETVKVKKREEEEKMVIIKDTIPGDYHIIAGSFKLEENAEKYSKKLILQGYKSEVLGPHNSFYFVSCRSFETKEKADSELNNICSSIGKGAWVLKFRQ
jgi:outer membrane protein assembly factor BamB